MLQPNDSTTCSHPTLAYDEYIRIYWGQEQIYLFNDIIRMWRWIIQHRLNTIFDNRELTSIKIPYICAIHTEGYLSPLLPNNYMIDRYIGCLKIRYPLHFNHIQLFFSNKDVVTSQGLRELVSYIDGGSTSILEGWNDNYFGELELD